MKLPSFTFRRERKHNTTTLFFFSWTSIHSFRIQFQKNGQPLANWTRWNKRDKVWRRATSLFKWRFLEVRQKYSAARRIFNSLLGVSSGDETLRLMFDILLEEAGLDTPLPANNTKGRRQLTELESVSYALSVNLRMTVVLLKITLFSYFILCFTWHKMKASKSNHWSSDLFMRHKVWWQKTSYYKKISKWILTLQTSFYSFS